MVTKTKSNTGLKPALSFTETAAVYEFRTGEKISRTQVFKEEKRAFAKLMPMLRDLAESLPTRKQIDEIVREHWTLPKMRRKFRECVNQLKLPF